ncbi:MAG: lamin tail domain-containing protein, partial [Ilumatobacteraceae bacterium]
MHQVGSAATALSGVDLSTYIRIGRFDLPEPTRTTPPVNSLLAQEVSAVTYNPVTDTLFVIGDGSTSVVQITKTGQLIDSMTLARGASPQGTEFYDTEGLTYVGGGDQFAFVEERDRQVSLFTYVPDTTLQRTDVKTVDLGTFVDNIGIEGISWDPQTSGFIAVKEITPEGLFQTSIDFDAGTATNGSATTTDSVNLFDPALVGVSDFADVFALSNLTTLTGPESDNLLVLSQEQGRIVNISRTGVISSALDIVSDPGNPLSVPNQQHEGLTMDTDGNLYVVSENGGGDINHPQLWVYAPSPVPNTAPTAVTLVNQTTSLAENTNTTTRLKVADVQLTDDGIGVNVYGLTGPDAAFFEVDTNGLYIKAGTVLDFETKNSYTVSVTVDDPKLGPNPDATSAAYTLTITDVIVENTGPVQLLVSEVSPWSSGNSPYLSDWFELTNTGTTSVNLSGYKMDDNSNDFAQSVALTGVTTLAPGQSAVFLENGNPAAVAASFITTWFGGVAPAGFALGTYSGGGVGLSSGADAVNIFDGLGNRVTGISFGTSTTGRTFDNTAGLGSTTLPLPLVTTLNSVGVNGAITSSSGTEIGSPGRKVPSVFVSEVWPGGSSSAYAADWFEVTNFGVTAVDMTGWRMDDNSNSPVGSVALNGVTTLAPGQSAIFIETALPATVDAFKAAWFGTNVPAGLQIGTYSGSGVGLSATADEVNLFEPGATPRRFTGVSFGTSTANTTFDNAAAALTLTTPSVVDVNGAFRSFNGIEVGSPGTTDPVPYITEVSPFSSGNSPYLADWFEVTNPGAYPLDISGWKMDDNSNSFALSVALNGVTTIAPGQSVIFLESATPATTVPAFRTAWYGATPPATPVVGTYSGSGVGLGTGGDAVNLFDSFGNRVTGVQFGPSTIGLTFDNTARLGSNVLPLPTVTRFSAVGINGAILAADGIETGSPGVLKADGDGDNVLDAVDNCPAVANPTQTDTDFDGTGDACDPDIDNDGVLNAQDAFPLDSTESVDTDGDGIGNNADADDDGDGVDDTADAFPLDSTESVDTDGDGIGNNADADDDGDGV